MTNEERLRIIRESRIEVSDGVEFSVKDDIATLYALFDGLRKRSDFDSDATANFYNSLTRDIGRVEHRVNLLLEFLSTRLGEKSRLEMLKIWFTR